MVSGLAGRTEEAASVGRGYSCLAATAVSKVRALHRLGSEELDRTCGLRADYLTKDKIMSPKQILTN